MMSSTFETVAGIIAETCDIPRETIKPESHAINDLGIDSLDSLDIASPPMRRIARAVNCRRLLNVVAS